jgi:CubicO group peptidase (beta-lactamase class C family)
MQDFTPADGHYALTADSRYPAYPFDMSARDLARFALLYLHGGAWNRAAIVPQAWVETSTRPYSDTASGGYGFLWWTADAAGSQPATIPFPAGSYWAQGNLGQYALVVPSLDLVFVNLVDERLTKRAVTKKTMAKIVRRVVAAAPKS